MDISDRGGSTMDKDTGAKYPRREPDQKPAIRRIQMGTHIATSRANGKILDSMRAIAESQLNQLEQTSRERLLTASEAAALHRIAQVFNIVDSGTRREQEAMSFKDFTDEELAAGEAYAMQLLTNK